MKTTVICLFILPFVAVSLLSGDFYTTAYAQTEAAGAPMAAAATPAPVKTSAAEGSETISLDFKDADINTVLRVLSLKSKVNIVAGPEVKGTVTIRLEDVPWQKALEVVLRTYDYVFERDGNIIRVTTREKMALEPVMTQTIVLNYTKATEIMEAIKDMLSERGRIKPADRTNALVITDIPTNLYRIAEIIKKLDQITPQAYIDSKVVKTDVSEIENLGIKWGTGGENNLGKISGASRPTTFPFPTRVNQAGVNRVFSNPLEQFLPSNTTAGDPRDFPIPSSVTESATYTFGTLDFSKFSSILEMLRTKSNVKVVSNPRITVLNNQTAKVQVGQQIPVPSFERNSQTGDMEVTGFSYRDVGVVLNVTPHINSASEILVELKPEVSSQKGEIDFGTNFSAPIFVITTAVTQVLMQSGQTIAIGGLLSDSSQLAEDKVPYASDIPLIGKLFRSKRQNAGENSKSETLFFVTVTTVDTEGQPLGKAARNSSSVPAQSAAPTAVTTATNTPAPATAKKTVEANPQTEKPVNSSGTEDSSKTAQDQATPATP